VIAILITFGEETGWRGFALPWLQRRHGALTAALVITPIWAVWHLPYFLTVATYRGYQPAGYIGFVFGLDRAHLAVQPYRWQHPRLRGLAWPLQPATGTAAATGTIQGVTSAFVYSQAFLLVGLELRARKRGEASILGPRRCDAPSSRRTASLTP
jgi:membrane protease YdiL (CAAX protease family)